MVIRYCEGRKKPGVIFSLSALFESGDVEAFGQGADGGKKKEKMALCHRGPLSEAACWGLWTPWRQNREFGGDMEKKTMFKDIKRIGNIDALSHFKGLFVN